VALAGAAGLDLDPWQSDALDLMLSVRDDGRWACFEYAEIVSRQNGKGSILEARALAGMLLLQERLIMWSAHEVKTALEGFRRLRACLTALGEAAGDNLIVIDDIQIKVNNTNGREGFERLDTGQRVIFVARSKGSGRGFSGDVNIIDEAYAYTDDQHSALMPTMSARPNPQLIYTSSPPLSGDTGEILYRLRKRATSGTPHRLGYRDWGAPGTVDDLRNLNLDSRKLWAETNPAYGVRISEEFIQSERESMSDEKFAIERLGLWPKQIIGGGAIDMGAWNGLMLDRESRRDGDVAIAVDIAPERDYAAIGLYGLRKDGTLGHVQIVDYRPGTDWLVDRIVEWRGSLDPIAVAMGKATFDSLAAELQKRGIKQADDKDAPKRGDLAVASWSDMSAATGQLLDAARQATFRHTGQSELDSSVAGAKTKLNADSLVWARKDAASDTSPLVAITLARWAYESRAHLVRKRNYNLLDSVF
jgi:phage terminase large subunit-like protein